MTHLKVGAILDGFFLRELPRSELFPQVAHAGVTFPFEEKGICDLGVRG